MSRSKKKRVLPSQQRYDESHPIVSFRLPTELYNRLKQHLGEQSFAVFVKNHLDDEEAKVKTRVEELARQRDNLWDDILNHQLLLRDLEEQAKKRRQEMLRPFEEEKSRLRAQIDGWYRQERKAFEETRLYHEQTLETLRAEIAREKEQAGKVKMERLFVEAEKKAFEQERQKWLEEREIWEKRVRQVTELINRCPWIFCHECPGAAFNQLLQNIMDTITLKHPVAKVLKSASELNQGTPVSNQKESTGHA